MGAFVKSVSTSQDACNIWVNYSDNGTSDTIHHKAETPEKAIEWLKLWYSDTSGGLQLIEQGIKTLERQITINQHNAKLQETK